MAICITAYESWGQSVVLEETAKRWANYFSIDLLCITNTKKIMPEWIDQIYEIKPWLNRLLPIRNNKLVKQLEWYDIIVCHDSIWFMDCAIKSKKPLVVICHGIFPAKYLPDIKRKIISNLSMLTYKYFYRKATKLVAISNFVRDWLIQYDWLESVLIYNWFARDKFYPLVVKEVNKKKPLLFFAWQVSKRKGVDLIILAIKILKEKYNNIQLNIWWHQIQSEQKIFENLVYENNLWENISFLWSIPHHELNKYYNQADLFVTASYCEWFWVPLVESVATWTPVVWFGGKQSATEEVIKGLGLWDVFYKYNEADLAKTIERVLKNKESLKIDNDFLAQLNWDITAKKYLNLFSSILWNI